MELKENSKIYESIIENYSIRFWGLFKNYLFIYLIIITLLIFFNLKSKSLITESCIAFVLFFLTIRFYDVKKWTKNKIEKIELKSETYEIQIVEKNKRIKISIPRKNLVKKLKWIGNRPKILELKILNREQEVLSIYSGGKSEIEYEIENIAYKLNNKTSH